MNIYQSYVFPDKLVSPVNGYCCKRITKQNINQFGFTSIDELHCRFPDFPTKTTDYYNQMCAGTAKGRTLKKGNRLRAIKHYQTSPALCKHCAAELPYHSRKNKFCSRACNASFHNKDRGAQTYETKEKIKLGLCKYHDSKPKYSLVYFLVCDECGKNFTINRRVKLCSSACRHRRYSKNGRKNASLTSRRSKDEIKLFELCLANFPDSISNHVIKDGWDADIVIPSLKIAILWNGPWHYKQLNMKNHSLLQVQTRDKIKTDTLSRSGWTVLVYEDRCYTPETAFADIKTKISKLMVANVSTALTCASL